MSSLYKGAIKMIRRVFATDDSNATAILRLVLGTVFLAHGAQKTFGRFGGLGYSGTMGYFTSTMHIPAPFAFLGPPQE
jgi:putative oxidoreductase